MPHLTPSGFFITGTDTEVGKTLVAAAIVQKLQSEGVQAIAYKPVVAGMRMRQEEPINEDVETLLLVSRRIAPRLKANDICSYFLTDPAAPHLVAQKEHITLDLEQMIEHVQKLHQQFEAIVVEGAGGFLVPINAHQSLADLAIRIQLPVILVVSMRLGCINHALLTAEAIVQRGLKLYGWVANQNTAINAYTQDNISTIHDLFQHRWQAPLLGTIPLLDCPTQDGVYSDKSIGQASDCLDPFITS